ncbi:stage III sporulation protein AA [Clostridium tarantellae]|uniref:Stage III sporulation protein AA n=1 Tax=Clostridium tarantellae TaxID=39493 RepID=A0A6I1MGV2_9CLOT|nr:stage III sporulation protein AA [Clostridium tarantellae]MPQ42766.1 stage III sporulation protein AA [Clostridium tarantellae]
MKEVLEILSREIYKNISSIDNLNEIQEIRIKASKPLIAVVNNKEIIFGYSATVEDIKNMLQKISNYSLYAFEEEIKQGYITIQGGHRIGLAGQCVIENGTIKTIKNIASLNIRICREVIGCSNSIMQALVKNGAVLNTLIISPPKCGKTTLLRDIARNISNGNLNLEIIGKRTVVVDERSEIAACYNGIPQMNVGIRTDVYDNCIKSEGMMIAIRSMGPEVLICDEIGTYKDMEAMLMAYNSGVNIIATMHGKSIEDIYNRPIFNEILSNKIINNIVVLSNREGVGTLEGIYTI